MSPKRPGRCQRFVCFTVAYGPCERERNECQEHPGPEIGGLESTSSVVISICCPLKGAHRHQSDQFSATVYSKITKIIMKLRLDNSLSKSVVVAGDEMIVFSLHPAFAAEVPG